MDLGSSPTTHVYSIHRVVNEQRIADSCRPLLLRSLYEQEAVSHSIHDAGVSVACNSNLSTHGTDIRTSRQHSSGRILWAVNTREGPKSGISRQKMILMRVSPLAESREIRSLARALAIRGFSLYIHTMHSMQPGKEKTRLGPPRNRMPRSSLPTCSQSRYESLDPTTSGCQTLIPLKGANKMGHSLYSGITVYRNDNR